MMKIDESETREYEEYSVALKGAVSKAGPWGHLPGAVSKAAELKGLAEQLGLEPEVEFFRRTVRVEKTEWEVFDGEGVESEVG